jgi:hypothetical protein
VNTRSYPADPADAALRIFLDWFGKHYARSTRVEQVESEDSVSRGTITIGRRWELGFALVNTIAPDADLEFEAARAAIEERLDSAGYSLALWVPRGAALPTGDTGLNQLLSSVELALPLEDGRLEVRRPVETYLRRTSTTGSVVTILGGLGPHWAQFTNRVPGSLQLNSMQLYRLPSSEEERDELAEQIVLAAQQPEIDDGVVIPAIDAWTANDLREGGSCVLGTPAPEDDEHAATLRRNLRKLLRLVAPVARSNAPTRALILLGASTYAEEEKLSWAIRGMDPTLYSGFDLIVVIADGLVKPLLEPARNTLPWDAPLG